MQGQPPLEYTLRTGVSAQRLARGEPGLDGAPLPVDRSSLVWDEPELKLSLGETGLRGLLPKLWLPVAGASLSRKHARPASGQRGTARAADGPSLAGACPEPGAAWGSPGQPGAARGSLGHPLALVTPAWRRSGRAFLCST